MPKSKEFDIGEFLPYLLNQIANVRALIFKNNKSLTAAAESYENELTNDFTQAENTTLKTMLKRLSSAR